MSFTPPPPDPVFPGMSFPDPVIGPTKRPLGQGCTSCVHQKYCRVFYWFIRYTEGYPGPDVGVQCASWSNTPSDQISTISADDVNYNNYENDEGLLTEPNPNGFVDPFSDS